MLILDATTIQIESCYISKVFVHKLQGIFPLSGCHLRDVPKARLVPKALEISTCTVFYNL